MVQLGAALAVFAPVTSGMAYDENAKVNATLFAMDAVKRKLRDPSSAEFRNVNTYEPEQRVLVVCGLVNAKNGFGGYAGYEAFVWFPLGADLKPDVRNGTALVGAKEIGDIGSLCRNAK